MFRAISSFIDVSFPKNAKNLNEVFAQLSYEQKRAHDFECASAQYSKYLEDNYDINESILLVQHKVKDYLV